MDNLYFLLCSYDNLLLAYKKARKHKTIRPEVLDFEKDLENNLLALRTELLFHIYRPQPLTSFIIRDPKTRKINKSAFRDRVVHHALCNIIEPFFEKQFIFDSYANRKGKGTLKAIQRFESFSNKISRNHTISAYAFKADIKHYFEDVNHPILINLIKRRIKDQRIIWLIEIILGNYSNQDRSMPLGNLTSQFFANIYLHELDYFVKQQLKIKYYLRYVDDFVLLHNSPKELVQFKEKINFFLQDKLRLQLHPLKSKIMSLAGGIFFLGLRLFPHHRLLKKSNLRKFTKKYQQLSFQYLQKSMSYDHLYNFMEGWIAYAKIANTYKLRKNILSNFETDFSREISTKEIKC